MLCPGYHKHEHCEGTKYTGEFNSSFVPLYGPPTDIKSIART